MLDRLDEYQKMSEAERRLWWYRVLHEKCHAALWNEFRRLDIDILDAGCGTGGLMHSLQSKGYSRVQGFDLADVAVGRCKEFGLNVSRNDLRDIGNSFSEKQFDAIISNDTLYFLTDSEKAIFISACHRLLRPGGIVVLNLPALSSFSGIHDLAVGIKRRFSRVDIGRFFDGQQFEARQSVYWPFLLSPLIYLSRLIQRVRLRTGLVKVIESDVKMPTPWVNASLLGICRFEGRHFGRLAPFGSSLFLVLRRVL